MPVVEKVRWVAKRPYLRKNSVGAQQGMAFATLRADGEVIWIEDDYEKAYSRGRRADLIKDMEDYGLVLGVDFWVECITRCYEVGEG